MSKQFENVSVKYGAPMGRASRQFEDAHKARSVSLFRVNLDSGGYDDGGAYWGLDKPLYCAVADCGGRQFTRAHNRAHAAAIFGLSNDVLKRGVNRDYIAALFRSYNGIGPALPPSWQAIDHLEYWFADNGSHVSTGGDTNDITPADWGDMVERGQVVAQ